MMFLLAGNVFFHLIEIRWADGEVRIAILPLKAGKVRALILHPLVGNSFELLHPFSLGDGAAESRQQMDVVLDTTYENGRTIEPFGNFAQMRVQLAASFLIPKEGPAVFGREHEVNVNY